VVFTREKESIPYWNKFLQGYYDASGVSSDNFDQAVQMGGQGDVSSATRWSPRASSSTPRWRRP
jgi:oligopeptide transport system substrate-binding protein